MYSSRFDDAQLAYCKWLKKSKKFAELIHIIEVCPVYKTKDYKVQFVNSSYLSLVTLPLVDGGILSPLYYNDHNLSMPFADKSSLQGLAYIQLYAVPYSAHSSLSTPPGR